MTPVTNSRKTLFTAMGAKIRGMLSSREPHLPIVNAGITSSTRSILGVSRSQGGSSDNAFSGLTVHFSINTPHQSRVLSQADDQGVDNPTSSTRQNDEPLADSASSPALEEGNAEVNVPIKHLVHPVQPGGVTAIRIGRRGMAMISPGMLPPFIDLLLRAAHRIAAATKPNDFCRSFPFHRRIGGYLARSLPRASLVKAAPTPQFRLVFRPHLPPKLDQTRGTESGT